MRKRRRKSEIVRACVFALTHNLGLQPHEYVLIVTDREKRFIAEAMREAAFLLTSQVALREIPVPEFPGREPPVSVAEDMLRADVILMPMTKSLSWTQARMNATESGARIASMPGISTETVLRTFQQDYESVRRRVNLLCDLLDDAEGVRITTDLGTEISFRAKGRIGRGRRAGVYTEKGAWGNLPCGEAFIAPAEGTANGVYIVDASHSGIGKIREPIRVEVREGRAQRITGGKQSEVLTSILRSLDNPDAFNVAEFGLGCNDNAEICGITLEDEKVLGTCHIALGANSFFGGKVDVGIHLDGVIRKPTISLDAKIIMHQGKLLIESV